MRYSPADGDQAEGNTTCPEDDAIPRACKQHALAARCATLSESVRSRGARTFITRLYLCATPVDSPPYHLPTTHLPAPLSSHPSSLFLLSNRQPPAAARNPADVRFPRWKVFKWVPDRSLDCSLPPFTFRHYIFCNVLEIRFSKTPVIIMQRVVLDQPARCALFLRDQNA